MKNYFLLSLAVQKPEGVEWNSQGSHSKHTDRHHVVRPLNSLLRDVLCTKNVYELSGRQIDSAI